MEDTGMDTEVNTDADMGVMFMVVNGTVVMEDIIEVHHGIRMSATVRPLETLWKPSISCCRRWLCQD